MHREKNKTRKADILIFLSMKIYFHYRVKEDIPSRKVIVAKIIKVFTVCGDFITALKKDSHFSLF
jgi:predicted phosphatase